MLMSNIEYGSILALFLKIPECVADLFMPVWGDPLPDHFKRLTSGHLLVFRLRESFMHLIKSGVTSHSLVIIVNERRRVVVGLPPKLHLVVHVYLGSFFLAKALQGSVVPLVDSPGLYCFGVIGQTHVLEK